MKKKNGFTLIELLAIIVILAIIAVITVPIILNIIETSKQGAAQDSAYGYKDAINKFYVSELLNNKELVLEGQYNVSTGGILNGNEMTNQEIPVSGDKPSGGKLHYSKNTLKGGCLVIGDYEIIFNGETAISTEKGDCSEYIYVDPNTPTIASCPGCKYSQMTPNLAIGISDMPETTNDYTTLTNEHSYFLGLIESTTNPQKIGRAFICGIEGETAFCLEGGIDESSANPKPIYESNVETIYDVFENCIGTISDNMTSCDHGSNTDISISFAYARVDGEVQITEEDVIEIKNGYINYGK